MHAATWVEVVLIVAVFVGLIVTCLVDPTGLADAKYGPRVDAGTGTRDDSPVPAKGNGSAWTERGSVLR